MAERLYDLVGDIHSHADELEALVCMGYVPNGKGSSTLSVHCLDQYYDVNF